MPANTSPQAIHRYKKKVYKRVVADLPKDLVSSWEEKLSIDGISKSEFIRQAISKYLGDTE